MKRFLLSAGIVCLSFVYNAQKNVFVNISPKVEGNPLQLGTTLVDLSGNSFEVTVFDYYLSNVTLIHDGGQIMVLTPEVYLIEPDNNTIYLGYLDLDVVEEIQFGVGVPANLNTINGLDAMDISAYPVGHPLSYQDPAMHWGWSSGYFCMIVSGNGDSNSDDIPDALFEIHSLGDHNYADVVLPVIGTEMYEDQLDININCNLDVWLTNVDLGTVGVLHGTSGVNSLVMKNPETLPVFSQNQTAGMTTLKIPGKLWFFATSSLFTVEWEGVKNASKVSISDVQGKVVASKSIVAMNGKYEISDLPAGTYQVSIYDAENRLLRTINTVR
jgi:hypothetical protein